MNQTNTWVLLISLLFLVNGIWAEVPEGVKPRRGVAYRVSSDCSPPSASSQLDINNVRCLLHNGGDMWWDLVGAPRYEIPKGSNRHSMFASSLWIGGLDDAGNLRIAAQTYRQSGLDFWPGPLTGGTSGGAASTGAETCEAWNKMFKINKTEIDAFLADFADGTLDDAQNYPNVLNWPAVGNPNNPLWVDADGNILEAFRPDGTVLYAAPFVDVDGNPLEYNPAAGDYPAIQGDQAIWWIVNDKGNVHTETGGQPIGVEIHMLAFAFTTANAVNDMTFYRQTVINRSSQRLNDTYIGQWVDADLGTFNDDYVGCDTTLGLGFCYNGDDNDNGATGYGLNPPAVGVDFFQGPLADPNDGIDNDKDGMIDEPNETIIMSKFVYYNNDFSLTGNPSIAQHYYGYLSGFWKDGTPIVDNHSNGGDGSGYGAQSPGVPTNFMFPGDACLGPAAPNSEWTEVTADNPAADRRFIQSAGPFTLQPGAVNEIVTGVVWARGFFNDQFGSVCELIKADRVAQALFDNGFQLLDGPDAPELAVSEYDQELLLSWGYPEELATVRNNFNESYRQADPVLKAGGIPDSVFEFQGYIIYQLADGTVGPNELNNPDRARIVAQCDVEDNVATIVNRTVSSVEGLEGGIILDEVMVQGANEGIFHSIRLDKDFFAQGADTRLKNYTNYYYAAIAYAYNDSTSDGRKFVQGNRFYQVVSALPHPEEIEKVGTVINSEYGDGVSVSKIAGVGNGGVFVRLDPSSVEEIVQNNSVNELKYQGGASPIEVKVVDPKKIQGKYYKLLITTDSLVNKELVSVDVGGDTIFDLIYSDWMLFEGDDANVSLTNPVYRSTYRIRSNDVPAKPRPEPLAGTERVIEDRGISITITDVMAAGDTLDEEGRMGVIGGDITYADPGQPWLNGLPDNESSFGGAWDWMRLLTGAEFWAARNYDKFEFFQDGFINGSWGPFSIARAFSNGPQGGGIAPGLPQGPVSNNRQVTPQELITFNELPDVDIVFTADITKWSRCVVVETSPGSGLGSGAWPLSAKWTDNVDKDGNSEGARTRTNHGLGWFPGYAINVNTGERVNVFFGESTWDQANNGNDMLWNPTSNIFSQSNFSFDQAAGRHYVYVTNELYDGCENLRQFLTNADESGILNFAQAIFFDNTGNNLKDAYKNVAWVGIPFVNEGFEFATPQNIPTDATVSLRVNQPFGSVAGSDELPQYAFNTVDIAAQTGEVEVAEDALEKILVVPNPYYAYSEYETGQLDNRVRVTNLPQKCRISIFTLNGHLVRQFTKDNENPFLDWDLRNHSGVGVASGMYIIHIDANIDDQNLGEKIIKLFAVMRPIDLDNF
ncbi:MAG: T9SS type A sorting domain-containing protein [Bacteroidia bacterium]|nr:T9SS type A sorting domain-containing protein [Bacteroidia bacterium]